MKRLLAVAALFAAAGYSASAEAQMAGSDTLAELTKDVLVACNETPVITYTGGGSGNGELALRNGTQAIASMSRPLTMSNTCVVAPANGSPTTSLCKTIALDGLAIVGDPARLTCGVKNAASAVNSFTVTDANGNGAVDCAGTTCPGNTYTFNSVFDVLRLVYAGLDRNGGRTTACTQNTECGTPSATVGNRYGHFEANAVHKVDSCVCSDGKPAPCADSSRVCAVDSQCTQSGTKCNVGAGLCARTCSAASPTCQSGATCNTSTGFCEGGNSVVTGTCRNTKCNSDERISLLNSWGNMFDCAGGSCTQLNHAFRRGDASGTTDTFSSLLGLANLAVNPWTKDYITPYCNGSDLNDWDPVRRACGPDNVVSDATGVHDSVVNDLPDDVCGRVGNLGVVLPIVTPESPTGLPPSSYVPSVTTPEPGVKLCAPGSFSSRPARRFDYPDGSFSFDCPEKAYANGTGSLCLAPKAADGTFDCMSFRTNVSAQFVSTANDGRILNSWARTATGTLIQAAPGFCSAGTCTADSQCGTSGGTCTAGICTNGSCIQNSQCGTGGVRTCTFSPAQRPVVGGYYRLKTPRSTKLPAVPRCGEDTSTEQIGCLTARTSCSIGFAGREAAASPIGVGQGLAFAVGGIVPTTDKVQNLLVFPADPVNAPVYPLARTLQECSMTGFPEGTCTAGACAGNADCGNGGTCSAGVCTAGGCDFASDCGSSGGVCNYGSNYRTLAMCLDNTSIVNTGRRCTAGVCARDSDCGTEQGVCNAGQCSAGVCTSSAQCGTSGGNCPATPVLGSVQKTGFVELPAFATEAQRCTDFDERFCTTATNPACTRDAGACATSGGCVDVDAECPASNCVTANGTAAGRCGNFATNTNSLGCTRFSH